MKVGQRPVSPITADILEDYINFTKDGEAGQEPFTGPFLQPGCFFGQPDMGLVNPLKSR